MKNIHKYLTELTNISKDEFNIRIIYNIVI